MTFKDLTGQKINSLTVIKRAEDKIQPSGRRKVQWECLCDCGNKTIVEASHLLSGHTRSCGCLKGEKHKKAGSKIYAVWNTMRARCHNPNNTSYERYGAKGVKVCKEWAGSFTAFYNWALENGYKDGLTIDRIDNNRNYCPENCRWVTAKEQNRNKRNNHFITYKGETKCLGEWAEILNLNYFKLYDRLIRRRANG